MPRPVCNHSLITSIDLLKIVGQITAAPFILHYLDCSTDSTNNRYISVAQISTAQQVCCQYRATSNKSQHSYSHPRCSGCFADREKKNQNCGIWHYFQLDKVSPFFSEPKEIFITRLPAKHLKHAKIWLQRWNHHYRKQLQMAKLTLNKKLLSLERRHWFARVWWQQSIVVLWLVSRFFDVGCCVSIVGTLSAYLSSHGRAYPFLAF